MNYLKQYILLIRKAQKRDMSVDTYYEKHHVFPKSLYGENLNLVLLTYKEHLVAHHLLYKASVKRYGINHYKTIKLEQALFCMLTCVSPGRKMATDLSISLLIQTHKDKVKYRPTEETKSKISATMKNRKFSQSHRENLSLALKGEKNCKYGKPSYFKGRNHTEESKKKMSLALSGENNPNYGRKRTPETIEKIKLGNLNNSHTKETKLLISEIQNPCKANWENVKTGEIYFFKSVYEMCNMGFFSKSQGYRLLKKEIKFIKKSGWKLLDTVISSQDEYSSRAYL